MVLDSWIPQGTARQTFAQAFSPVETVAPATLPEVWKEVQHMSQEMGLETEYFFQVRSLILWGASHLKPEDQSAIGVLLLALQQASLNGSTCWPLKTLDHTPEFHRAFIQIGLAPTKAIVFAQRLTDLWQTHQLSWLIGAPGTFRPLIWHEAREVLYQQRYFEHEQQLLRLFEQRFAQSPALPSLPLIQEAYRQILHEAPIWVQGQPMLLADEQRAALLAALASPLTIISGGPGTGKTSIVVMILRLLYRLGLAQHIGLAAPTGRAAKRLGESLGQSLRSLMPGKLTEPDRELAQYLAPPQTLHRLLGYNPRARQYRYHAYSPLAYDLLIVDETSMVDMELMTRLLEAVSPALPQLRAPARLILLGDAQQLPSVGAGAVLMDLTAAHPRITKAQKCWFDQIDPSLSSLWESWLEVEEAPLAGKVVRLTQSYRQRAEDPAGRNILTIAQAIHQASPPDSFFNPQASEPIGVIQQLSEFPGEKVWLWEKSPEKAALELFVKDWCQRFFASSAWQTRVDQVYPLALTSAVMQDLDQLFALFNRCRVLTALREAQAGAEGLNRLFREQIAGNAHALYAGLPLMIQENDYENDLFNGDVGLVLAFASSPRASAEWKVVFPSAEGYRLFAPHQLRATQPAYAWTVHKSQGAEYEHIALVLPTAPNLLLTKELIYTALTRAKKSVLIFGTKDIWNYAIQQGVQRFSGMRQAWQP